MTELRYTDTNSADDARGRAFGLEGNLYLPLALATVLGIGGWALLRFVAGFGWFGAAVLPAVPVGGVLAWALLLRHGKPAGYDRDWMELWIEGAGFSLGGKQPEARE